MAGAREIGIGVARALSLESGPNPFPLTFKGETVTEAADIVSAVLRECEDAGIKLAAVELNPELFQQVRGQSGTAFRLIENASLICEARFLRT